MEFQVNSRYWNVSWLILMNADNDLIIYLKLQVFIINQIPRYYPLKLTYSLGPIS